MVVCIGCSLMDRRNVVYCPHEGLGRVPRQLGAGLLPGFETGCLFGSSCNVFIGHVTGISL